MQETLNTLHSLRWKFSDFRFMEVLGRGRAWTIYRAVHVSVGMEFAIKKCYLRTSLERQRLEREIAVHSSIFHPNIARFYGSFRDDEGNWYLILEYAGGDLYNLLYVRTSSTCDDEGVLSEAHVCQNIMGPLVSAVAYLHNDDIIHSDIKPENLIVCDGMVSLAGFGFVTDLKRHRAITRWGRENNLYT